MRSSKSGHRFGFRVIHAGSIASLLVLSTSQIAWGASDDDTPAVLHRHAKHPVTRAGAARTTPKPSSESVTVLASRNVSHGTDQVVSRQAMDRFIPGTSPLQILSATTPGVSFGSDDPFGLDTWSNTLYVRGFDQDQIGATLDGIPLGDQGFQQYNGLDVNEAIIQDNLAGVSLSQGAGAVDIPSTQNLGGALTYRSSDPDDKLGGRVSQTFGSNNTFRTFARVDSGVLNPTGTKFYLSYMRTDNDKWKGYGYQLENQANAKLVQPVGDYGKITAFFDYSDFAQFNYLNMSLNMIDKLGSHYDYLYPNYTEAYQAAQGIYTPAVQSLGNATDEENATFYDGAQTQWNWLYGLTGDFQLAPNLNEKTILYMHQSSGNYTGAEPENPALIPNGTPFVQGDGKQEIRRLGVVEDLSWNIANHVVSTGVWYENNSFHFPFGLYEEPPLGQGTGVNPLGSFSVPPLATELLDEFNTNTFQYYLEDTYNILPTLSLHAGFRSVLQTTYGGTKTEDADFTGQAALPDGDLTTANAFLPHVSVNYHFHDHNELYIDIAENERAYTYAPWIIGNGGAWSAENQSVFQADKANIRPERTWNYVLGYRYNSRLLTASSELYHTDYYNRLVNAVSGSTMQPVSVFANVGRETINGGDISATIRPFRGLEIFNSVSYTDAEYQGGLDYQGTFINLSGKNQVAFPRFMYKADASYGYGRAKLNFNVSYTDRRPLSYTNDVYVPSYWLASLSADYNLGPVGFARNIRLNFGIYNLFNTVYVGGMGIVGFPVSGDYATLFIGAPRQYFGTLSAQF